MMRMFVKKHHHSFIHSLDNNSMTISVRSRLFSSAASTIATRTIITIPRSTISNTKTRNKISTHNNIMSEESRVDAQTIQGFCEILASKQPTPGGGASAAIGAAIGASTASMSAAYTQRKKDEASGAATAARNMIARMDTSSLLSMADDDVKAYQSLQSTWKKDSGLTPEQVSEIEANALRVPTVLMEACHQRILAVHEFLPQCNPNITSDAKVGIHQLAGAARSAYQTVLVNSPPEEERERLGKLLLEIQEIETSLLDLTV